MLILPAATSPVRALFTLNDLADIAAPSNRAKLPGFRQALTGARASMAAQKVIRSIHTICLRADGRLWLIEVRRTGTWRRRWDFGAL